MIKSFKIVKLYYLLIPTLLFITCIYGCGSKEIEEIKPIPTPSEPEPVVEVKGISYILSAENTVEFIDFLNGRKVKDLDESQITSHFGNRVNYFQPDSLHIDKDSLYVYKSMSPQEVYHIKWESNSLFILNELNKEWNLWAQREVDSTITLDVGYFKRVIRGDKHANSAVGQQYSLTDYKLLLETESSKKSSMIWLVRHSVFTPIKK